MTKKEKEQLLEKAKIIRDLINFYLTGIGMYKYELNPRKSLLKKITMILRKKDMNKQFIRLTQEEIDSKMESCFAYYDFVFMIECPDCMADLMVCVKDGTATIEFCKHKA